MQRPGDDQPTVFSRSARKADRPGPAGPISRAMPARRWPPADGSPDRPPEIARRTGIVFVHGIGTQAPAETFLDWSAPIVELLTDWRAAASRADRRRPAASTTRSGAPSSTLQRRVATVPRGRRSRRTRERPRTTWVLTEAWWAADLRAPSLGRTIDYLRRRHAGWSSTGIAAGLSRPDASASTSCAERDRPSSATVRCRSTGASIEGLDCVQSQAFGARPCRLAGRRRRRRRPGRLRPAAAHADPGSVTSRPADARQLPRRLVRRPAGAARRSGPGG